MCEELVPYKHYPRRNKDKNWIVTYSSGVRNWKRNVYFSKESDAIHYYNKVIREGWFKVQPPRYIGE